MLSPRGGLSFDLGTVVGPYANRRVVLVFVGERRDDPLHVLGHVLRRPALDVDLDGHIGVAIRCAVVLL
jgi:hypothetical protein